MAPVLSCHLPVLLFLLVAISQVATEDHDTLSCFYNSRANISCVWSPAGGLPAPSCRVSANPKLRSWRKHCELLPVAPASWACDLILDKNPDAQSLTAADEVLMSVQCQEAGNWTMVMSQNFKPFNALRLFAPCALQVTLRDTQFCNNVTWGVPHSSHYVESHLEFEVQKRTLSQKWEDTPVLPLKQNQKWICLENLAADTPYQLRVRVRVQPQEEQQPAWSPWSEVLAFSTTKGKGKAAEVLVKTPMPFPWTYPLILGLCGTVGFILLTYFLTTNPHVGSWLTKFVKCHIPDPSEFFIQLSSEHGGDFQKWLSSPFPSSAFSPGGLAPEISPLEVLDRDSKPAQGPSLTGGLSPASCYTNQGYFFFHLPDALEVEACQVYFTYDPCEEEPEEGVPGAPEAPLLVALPAQPREEDDYCSFPAGDNLLRFPPVPPTAPLSTAPGSRPLPCTMEPPRDGPSQPPQLPSPGAPGWVQLGAELGEAEAETPGPNLWSSPPGPGQVKAPTSCLTSNPDAYLSLQDLQDQGPAQSV